jgi:D-arabinose 1-dehydrogenase-like Zn-dependent alcohol dehydrogenase
MAEVVLESLECRALQWRACGRRRGEAYGGDWEAEVRPCGYVDYMIAPAAGLASIPDGLSAVKAAPLMCAGVTTFNARRHGGRA